MCPDITYTIYSESNLFRSGYYHVLYHEALFLVDVRARSYWVYWSGDKQDCTSQKGDIKHLTYVTVLQNCRFYNIHVHALGIQTWYLDQFSIHIS